MTIDTSSLKEKARLAVGRRNYDYAVETYREVLKLEPNDVEARRELRAVEVRVVKETGASRAGAIQDASGYVLFRYVDLEAKSVVLKQNDRFLKLGKLDADVYVTALRPNGHYTDQGGATMVKAFFKDRQPSRQGDA